MFLGNEVEAHEKGTEALALYSKFHRGPGKKESPLVAIMMLLYADCIGWRAGIGYTHTILRNGKSISKSVFHIDT